MEVKKAKVHTTGSSLTITLPDKFVKEHNIRKGDEIAVIFDSFLQIVPHNLLEDTEPKLKEK